MYNTVLFGSVVQTGHCNRIIKGYHCMHGGIIQVGKLFKW